jgi:hypothetical protein
MCRLREFHRTLYVGELNGNGMIPRGVVFAEIGGCMEEDVNAFKTGRKLGYLPDVSDDDAGCHVSKRLLRFLSGPGQCPYLMAGLMKNSDQVVS